jgi:hypothetical protein
MYALFGMVLMTNMTMMSALPLWAAMVQLGNTNDRAEKN